MHRLLRSPSLLNRLRWSFALQLPLCSVCAQLSLPGWNMPRIVLACENNYRFCMPCQAGYYLYDSGNCLASCFNMFNAITTKGYLACESPCKQGQFLYPDRSCQKTCPTSFAQKVDGKSYYCAIDLTQQEISQARTISGMQRALNTMIGVLGNTITLLKYTNPVSSLFVILSNMLQYLRYIKIHYPSRLQVILDSDQSFSINIIPDIPAQLAAQFLDSELPDNFQKYNLPSSFFVNFWHPGIVLLGFSVGLLIICLIIKVTKKCRGFIHKACVRCRRVLKWNYLLVLYVSSYDQIVMFSSFEFRTLNVYKIGPIMSFLLCIIFNVLSVYILVKMLIVLISIRRSSLQQNNRVEMVSDQSVNSINNASRWTEYEVVFDEYKDASFLQQAYLLILSIRIYLFYVIISYICDYPLVQMILITLLNLIMVLYLAIKRPPKKKIVLVENLAPEMILLVVNILLAFLDHLHVAAQDKRDLIGDMVIWINTGFGIMGAVYLVIKLGITLGVRLRKIILKHKRRPNIILPHLRPRRVGTNEGLITHLRT